MIDKSFRFRTVDFLIDKIFLGDPGGIEFSIGSGLLCSAYGGVRQIFKTILGDPGGIEFE